MTPIELEAALLLQGSPARKGFPITYDISRAHAIEALCSLIERHEAFRQEVSEALVEKLRIYGTHYQPFDNLHRFIIAKPDPLVEIFGEIGLEASKFSAGDFRKALSERGLKIVEADNAA